jgi:NAD(P)-dependent dehydrogenase (short-subunit alcohol dehydrogenase family)
MYKINVLISGANSDLAKPMIKKVLALPNVNQLHFLTHSEFELADERVSVHKVDFSIPDSFEKINNLLKDKNITHFIQYHGFAYEADDLNRITFESFSKTMNINLNSVVAILKVLLPQMEKGKFGRIVLMSTASANYGGGINGFSYGMAKHGILYLTKHLAKYYTKFNILTNVVSPGFILSKFHTEVLGRSVSELQKRAESIRLGRSGSAEDVTKVIFSLAFENDYISGENLKIDGGDFI